MNGALPWQRGFLAAVAFPEPTAMRLTGRRRTAFPVPRGAALFFAAVRPQAMVKPAMDRGWRPDATFLS